jgi:hypothetical protein
MVESSGGRVFDRGRWVPGEGGELGMNLLRLLRLSRMLAMRRVLVNVGEGCPVRPLPTQQEEAMKAMKTLFEYSL